MGFRLGLVVGSGVGYWLASRSSEQKRQDVEQLLERIRSEPRFEQLRDSVSRTLGGGSGDGGSASSAPISG